MELMGEAEVEALDMIGLGVTLVNNQDTIPSLNPAMVPNFDH